MERPASRLKEQMSAAEVLPGTQCHGPHGNGITMPEGHLAQSPSGFLVAAVKDLPQLGLVGLVPIGSCYWQRVR